jgi:hypothetical protein
VTEDDLYRTVATWVKRFSKLPKVIADRPGKPRPDSAYGMLNLIRSQRVHLPTAIEYEAIPGATAEPFEQTPVIEWEWVFSFNVYATNATDYARRVETAGSVQAGLETLQPLTLHTSSAIRRLPEMIQGKWEDRVQMDLTFRGMARDGIPVDVVEHVPVTFRAPVNRALPNPSPAETYLVGSLTLDKPEE